MDKEKVKKALHEKHGCLYSNDLSSIVNVMLDAIEWSGQDDVDHDASISTDTLERMRGFMNSDQVTTGSLVLCPSCSGKGCPACKGAGTLKDVRHTPSA